MNFNIVLIVQMVNDNNTVNYEDVHVNKDEDVEEKDSQIGIQVY